MANNLETQELMNNDEFLVRLVELRDSEGSGLQWEVVREKVKDEFGKEVSIPTLTTAYRKAMAMGITVEKKAIKNFTHLLESMKARFERMLDRSKSMEEAWDETLRQLDENDELDPLVKATTKLKLMDSLEKIHKIFTSQFQIVLDEIDKIKIEQKKIIYTDADIIQKINENLPIILKNYHDQGKIQVIDKSILQR